MTRCGDISLAENPPRVRNGSKGKREAMKDKVQEGLGRGPSLPRPNKTHGPRPQPNRAGRPARAHSHGKHHREMEKAL